LFPAQLRSKYTYDNRIAKRRKNESSKKSNSWAKPKMPKCKTCTLWSTLQIRKKALLGRAYVENHERYSLPVAIFQPVAYLLSAVDVYTSRRYVKEQTARILLIHCN